MVVGAVHALSIPAVLLRLCASMAFGAAIGLERESSGQAAGLRTHISVALGAALFGLISIGGFDHFVGPRERTTYQVDVTRVASQVVVGIGFIGGGAIVKTGGIVRGLTTAGSLWVTAAVGLALGLGMYAAAGIATGGLLLGLVGLRQPRRWLRRRSRPMLSADGAHWAYSGPGRIGSRRRPRPGHDPRYVLGIDIGGSGIKGAPVELHQGRLLTRRHRLHTPHPADPDAIAGAVAEIVRHFAWDQTVGCTFPGPVVDGVALSGVHLHHDWANTNPRQVFQAAIGCPVGTVLNDADAALLAELHHGAARTHPGLVAMVTFGTGIGTSLSSRGVLVPNTELANIDIDGVPAAERASNRARKERHLTWQQWADAANGYLQRLEALVHPELIIIGGGVSQHHQEFTHLLQTTAVVIPASLGNNAGIAGAALGVVANDGIDQVHK